MGTRPLGGEAITFAGVRSPCTRRGGCGGLRHSESTADWARASASANKVLNPNRDPAIGNLSGSCQYKTRPARSLLGRAVRGARNSQLMSDST
jgi:hypothetical protein